MSGLNAVMHALMSWWPEYVLNL